MKLLVNLVFLISILHLSAEEGLWNLQLSPQTVASVPFGSAHVSVWEHATDRGRFYAMPQACLMSDQAKVRENAFTGKTELTLRVLMWSEEAREAVHRYLVSHVNTTVLQVDLLPMERIRLMWVDPIRRLPDYYQLINHWQSNTHLPTVASFTIVCSDAERCQALKEAVVQDPHQVNGLELQYVINARRAARRQLTVTGSDLVRGDLYTRLANMNAASSVRYLRSDDVKRLTSETVQNIISSVVTDADYVETEDQASVSDLLERVFQRHKVSTEQFTSGMWDSVFWNRDYARPDRVTNYLNQVLSVDASDSRNFVLDQTQRSTQAEVSLGFFDLFGVGGSGGSSSATSRRKEELLSTLRQRFSDVQWSGEQFKVKPMILSRINLATLNTSTSIASFNVQVRRYESVQGVKLRPRCGLENQTSSLTPDLVQARLTDRIDNITNIMTDRLDIMSNRMTTAFNLTLTFLLRNEFCYLPDHWCSSVPNYSSEDGVSLTTCRSRCRADPRCNSFTWYRPSETCRLKTATCPMDKLLHDTTEVYYVKPFNISIASVSMMGFLESFRGGDLCRMIRNPAPPSAAPAAAPSGGEKKNYDVVGKAKGQGQDKSVLKNRNFKDKHKGRMANHNRRAQADKKMSKGMF